MFILMWLLCSISQTSYKDMILAILTRLSWGPTSQELSAGKLPLEKKTHSLLKERISEVYIFYPCPTHLHVKGEHQLFFSW